MTTSQAIRNRKAQKAALNQLAEAIGDDFTDHELATIATLGTAFQVEAGRTLIIKDRYGAEAFIITSGAASVAKEGKTVAVLGAGDVLGEVSLLNLSKRNADVVAETSVSGDVFTPREFSSLMFQCPGIDARVRELAMDRDDSGKRDE